jgi:hypothetical protein
MRRIAVLMLLPAVLITTLSLSAVTASAAGVCSPSAPQYCPAPTVATGLASKVTTTSATLNGIVDPNGASTNCVFGYGKTTSYGMGTSSVTVPAGTTAVSLSLPITGLSAKTIYHFELACTNAGGSGLGGDRTFTTLAVTKPAKPKSKLSIGKRKETVSKKGVVKFLLICKSSTTCKGKFSLSSHSKKSKSLGKTVKYTIRGKKRKTISFKLSKKALKQLKKARHKREKAKAKAVDSDKKGAKATVTLIFR